MISVGNGGDITIKFTQKILQKLTGNAIRKIKSVFFSDFQQILRKFFGSFLEEDMYKCQFKDGGVAYLPEWSIYCVKINESGRKILEYKDSSGVVKQREVNYVQAVAVGDKI